MLGELVMFILPEGQSSDPMRRGGRPSPSHQAMVLQQDCFDLAMEITRAPFKACKDQHEPLFDLQQMVLINERLRSQDLKPEGATSRDNAVRVQSTWLQEKLDAMKSTVAFEEGSMAAHPARRQSPPVDQKDPAISEEDLQYQELHETCQLAMRLACVCLEGSAATKEQCVASSRYWYSPPL